MIFFPLFLYNGLLKKYARNKYFQPDSNQNYSAEYFRFVSEFVSEFLPIKIAGRQIANVTMAIIPTDSSARPTLLPAISARENPVDNASMEVATA